MNKQAARGAQIVKPPILKIYSIECVVLLCVSVGLLVVDMTTAYSALIGGLVSIGPNSYFACSVFRYSGARAAVDVTRAVYRAEVLKFVLSAALFAGVFVLVKPLAPSTLFAVFIVTTVINTLLIFKLGNP